MSSPREDDEVVTPAASAPSPTGPSGPSGPSTEQLSGAVRARRRAAPRYRVFIGLGALVGALAAAVLTSTLARDGEFGLGAVLGYTGVLLALVGGLLGGAVAVLLDRRR